MTWLRDVVDAREFHAGLVSGAVVALGAGAASVAWWAWGKWPALLVWRKRRAERASSRRRGSGEARALGLAGLAFAVASLAAIDGVAGFDRVTAVPSEVVGALAALGAAGALASWPRIPRVVRIPLAMVLSVPGAWLLAERTDVPGPAWLRTTVLVAAAVVGPLVADADRRLRASGAGPLLLLVTVGGVYATVPDTEQALVLLGVALPIALVSLPAPVLRLGGAGSSVAVGTILWAAAHGAVGRPASMIGAVGAFALFLTIPVTRFVRRPQRWRQVWRRRGRWTTLAVLGVVQAAVALYAAQVAGPERDATTAGLVLAPVAVVALLAGWLFAPVRGRGPSAGPAQEPAPIRWRSSE